MLNIVIALVGDKYDEVMLVRDESELKLKALIVDKLNVAILVSDFNELRVQRVALQIRYLPLLRATSPRATTPWWAGCGVREVTLSLFSKLRGSV